MHTGRTGHLFTLFMVILRLPHDFFSRLNVINKKKLSYMANEPLSTLTNKHPKAMFSSIGPALASGPVSAVPVAKEGPRVIAGSPGHLAFPFRAPHFPPALLS